MVRAQEITRPSRARLAACSRLAGVIRLSVPRSSSAPQRPQLLSEAYQPRISCSVGIVRTAVTDDQLTRPGNAAEGGLLLGGSDAFGLEDAVHGWDAEGGQLGPV